MVHCSWVLQFYILEVQKSTTPLSGCVIKLFLFSEPHFPVKGRPQPPPRLALLRVEEHGWKRHGNDGTLDTVVVVMGGVYYTRAAEPHGSGELQSVDLSGPGRSPASRAFERRADPSLLPESEVCQCDRDKCCFQASVPGLQGSHSTAAWGLQPLPEA